MPFEPVRSTIEASVVICTHNPRPDYFARVLDGLRKQTLPSHRWEFLIVDNASQAPLATAWDVSWHSRARHISEDRLGLYWARRRGIQEAMADLIIFVDDDNVLDGSYLEEAIRIEQNWPLLGVWGSGSIHGDLEIELPESLRKHQSWLPVRHLAAPRWSNFPFHEDVIPIGAGLCVRKEVALAYLRFCDQSSIQIVGREGNSLTGHEEVEISFVCCRNGLGIGVFPQLKMSHLIPKHRLSEEYFVRFVEGTCLSNFVLQYKWQDIVPESLLSLKTLLSLLKAVLLYRGVDRKIRVAWVRALAKAKKIIEADVAAGSRKPGGSAGQKVQFEITGQ